MVWFRVKMAKVILSCDVSLSFIFNIRFDLIEKIWWFSSIFIYPIWVVNSSKSKWNVRLKSPLSKCVQKIVLKRLHALGKFAIFAYVKTDLNFCLILSFLSNFDALSKLLNFLVQVFTFEDPEVILFDFCHFKF